jgi:divalent metal cation (Fe/Co/Zn/Cd) transporter
VHELVTRLEAQVKRKLPQLSRVTIHPEPGSDNRR